MKFMKLGSKPDLFQSEGDNIRYVATELATDMVISIEDVKFHVHKFPLLSKSPRLQNLIATSSYDTNDEVNMDDIPGGPAAFEICAKFCYGMAVTLNAYNVVAARCAAEYLEMHETVEKGNLVYKIDIFLSSGIFRSWKDSIILLQTMKAFLPWLEGSKVVTNCIDSVAMRACTDPSRVDWSYMYNHRNGVRKQQTVPKDWWVEDLCDLPIDLYKRVITMIKGKGRLSADVIGEALRAYSVRRLPGFRNGITQGSGNHMKYRYVVDIIISLLPLEKGSVLCSFLLKLLSVSIMLECGEMARKELVQRIVGRLEEATIDDLLMRGEKMMYNVDVVHDLVEGFVNSRAECADEFGFDLDGSKTKVARLVAGYLAEVARDPLLPLPKFVSLAEMVSGFPSSNHDGIYWAIDTYLKEHKGLTKSEKKRICQLMDCRRLSGNACAHAVENEKLPSRVVVQILFFEQTRASRAAGPRGSSRSSRSATTTNSDEDWDGNLTSEELKDFRGELVSQSRIKNGSTNSRSGRRTNQGNKVGTPKKVKMMLLRLLSKSSTSDISESRSTVPEPELEPELDVGKMMPIQMQKKVLLTK